jgi:alkylation response protein AidB-like acyl-CoA dehydrogenase
VPELAVVFEEMGRALVPSPYFATVGLAAQTLLASGDESACRRYLPQIADGSITATLAVSEEAGSWNLADAAAVAQADEGGGWTITGTKMFVVDGDRAELLLVIARDCDDLALYAVAATDPGVTCSRLDTLDPTRRLGRIDLVSASAQRIGPPGDATPLLTRALDLASVVLAAEQVGGTQACLDSAVDYARVRVQFDRPIGSFQAIKHKCAEVLICVESARAAVLYAASAADDADPDEFDIAATVAAAYCGPAYTRAAKENIQIHGGVGYTWEHDAHLHLKRAKTSELLFGAPALHLARVAELSKI